jgi:hypothetical protein
VTVLHAVMHDVPLPAVPHDMMHMGCGGGASTTVAVVMAALSVAEPGRRH